ncbi:NepR family anti-sigma factor [Acetobacter sp.]|uniref:NepR family anti-sigma factor n=1 Tax=Acetobacter sp. TaxID=440 RepID=UPI0039ED346D
MAQPGLDTQQNCTVTQQTARRVQLPRKGHCTLEFRLGKSMEDTPSRKPKKARDEAFNIWLRRGLHQLFDDVVNEPVPEELLKLIQEDREKQD